MKHFLIAFLLLSAHLCFGHQFYISIADMEYDSVNNRINVSLKMTAHDFEHVLELKSGEKLVLEEISDSSAENELIAQYLKHNLKLFSKDEELEMSYLGLEVTNRDDVYCYFFFSNAADYSTIKIINKLLFSISDQQQNIVHYKYSGFTKSVTLVPAKSEEWITFNKHEDD